MDATIDQSNTDSGLTRSAPPPDPRTGMMAREPAPGHDPAWSLPAPGQTGTVLFGEYEVTGELGEGGMGRVYKAVDRKLGRVVAVKVLRTADPFEANRFRGEAELIAKLDHPNIVQIFAIETAPDGRPYLVLEFAEGGSLDRELGGQPQEPRRAAEMVETLSRAVQFAHDKGVIHRDLKPANVLRGKDRALKLTDFGLAKQLEVSSGMTPSGAVMGTPSYMAPEQASGNVKELGPATDVYGLGAILYDMLTGRPPFRGVNMVETLEQVRWMDPAPPSRLVPRLHRDLATICLKCLRKAPSQRYATAGELADDLRRWLNGETITARPAPSWERAWRQVRRRPWQAATAAAVGLTAILLVAGGLYYREVQNQKRQAEREKEAQAKLDQQKDEADRQKEAHEREKEAVLRANETRLRKQARDSLTALNNIRELILDGELSRKPGLDPLYRALSAYYNDLIAQKDSGFDKIELADGLVKVGDLFRRTGQKDQARDAYSRAADQCRTAAATDPKAREVLAAAVLKGGQVAFELNDDRAVQAACDEADALLAALKPAPAGPIANPTAARQIAQAYYLRGQVLRRADQFEKAEAAYRRSVAVSERLAEGVPADLQTCPPDERKRAVAALTDLGRGYAYLGTALLDAGKTAEAETAYWRSHELRQRVVAAFAATDKPTGEELDARYQLARSWGNFATLHTRSRALGTARYFAQQSLDAHAKLVELDPVNVEYRLEVCGRHVQVAELDMLLWVRPGVKLDDRLRAEIAHHLDEAKKVPEDQESAKGKRSRRADGVLATAIVLRCALVADTADPQAVREELFKAYTLLGELCKEHPGAAVDPHHLYYKVAAVSLLGDLNGTPLTADRRKQRLDELKAAAERLGPHRKHPDDIEHFRAFRILADDPGFKQLMATLRATAGPKPPAP